MRGVCAGSWQWEVTTREQEQGVRGSRGSGTLGHNSAPRTPWDASWKTLCPFFPLILQVVTNSLFPSLGDKKGLFKNVLEKKKLSFIILKLAVTYHKSKHPSIYFRKIIDFYFPLSRFPQTLCAYAYQLYKLLMFYLCQGMEPETEKSRFPETFAVISPPNFRFLQGRRCKP